MSAPNINSPHLGLVMTKLENGYAPSDEIVRDKHAWLAYMMHSFSGWEQRCYLCEEDPEMVVGIGGWDSTEQHYKDFQASSLCRDALEEFGDVADIRALWHADIPFKELHWDVPYMTLVRFWVRPAMKVKFEANVPNWIPLLTEKCESKISYGWKLAGGWADKEMHDDMGKYDEQLKRQKLEEGDVEDEEDTEEWDMLVPWKSKADWDRELGSKCGMDRFVPVLYDVARVEVKHLITWNSDYVKIYEEDDNSEEGERE